ncbi:MAG: hypothetical protein OK457_04905 [Thaumarchaeota archaeon]|nr:hypothetical protein [Nitrososphaerota archaeon]
MRPPAGEKSLAKTHLPRNWKIIAFVFLVEVVLLSLALWTAFSPAYFSVQSKSEIANLFQFAKTTENVSITDSTGDYNFVFGMDYNSTQNPSIPTITEVYASLSSATFLSALAKGVALHVDDASIFFDGVQVSGVMQRVNTAQNIIFVYLSYVLVKSTSGVHHLSVRLLLSTVDVNYIGYFSGNQFLAILNGTVEIS